MIPYLVDTACIWKKTIDERELKQASKSQEANYDRWSNEDFNKEESEYDQRKTKVQKDIIVTDNLGIL